MAPSKKELIKALVLSYRSYFTQTGYNKSLEWEVCKVYKGDCKKCFWSVMYKDSDTLQFPCKLTTIPPINPNLAEDADLYRRMKLISDVEKLIKETNYTCVKIKTPLFISNLKRIINNHEEKKITSALSERYRSGLTGSSH